MREHNWMGFHIHLPQGVYGRHFDALLVKVIAPLIADFREANQIDRFFFIRFADRGSHIRLRLLPQKDADPKMLRERLTRDCEAFFASVPVPPDPGPHMHAVARFRPTGIETRPTVLETPYFQELERYGQAEAMNVIEKEFESSSNSILRLIARLINQPFGERLGVGMQMLIIILDELFGPDKEAIGRFSTNLTRAYLDAEIGFSAKSMWGDPVRLREFLSREYRELETPPPVQEMLNAFAETRKSLEDEYKLVVPLARKRANRDCTIKTWQTHLSETLSELRALADKGRMQVSNFEQMGSKQQVSAIAASILHLNANRLGLHLVDEAWLAYLCSVAVEDEAWL